MSTLAEKLAAKRAASMPAPSNVGTVMQLAAVAPHALPERMPQPVDEFVRVATPSISVEVANPPTDRDTARAQFKALVVKHGYIWNRHTPAECYSRLIAVNRFITESEKLTICQGLEARK